MPAYLNDASFILLYHLYEKISAQQNALSRLFFQRLCGIGGNWSCKKVEFKTSSFDILDPSFKILGVLAKLSFDENFEKKSLTRYSSFYEIPDQGKNRVLHVP